MTFAGRAVVVLGQEGEVVTALGSRYRFKVLGDATDGSYSLVEETLLDPEGPPMHVHDREEELRMLVITSPDDVIQLALQFGTRIVGPPVGQP